MSIQGRKEADFSIYDQMETSLLEERLRQLVDSAEEKESDLDAVLYITEVLARRDRENVTEEHMDVQASWASFQEHYLPLADREGSIYDFDEDPELDKREAPLSFLHANVERFHRSLRGVTAAVVVVVCMLAASATASAFGFDIWTVIVNWTSETFDFSVADVRGSYGEDVPEQLCELKQAIIENGFAAEHILPTYLPKGYGEGTVEVRSDEHSTDIICMLPGESGNIILQYRVGEEDPSHSTFEKDLTDPDMYKVDGMTHYIMTNMDQYEAAWLTNGVECAIYGVETKDEIIKMIDSLYGG